MYSWDSKQNRVKERGHARCGVRVVKERNAEKQISRAESTRTGEESLEERAASGRMPAWGSRDRQASSVKQFGMDRVHFH